MLDLIKWEIIFIKNYLCLQKQKAFRIKLMIKHEWWWDYCIRTLFIYLFSLEINLMLDWVTLSIVFFAVPCSLGSVGRTHSCRGAVCPQVAEISSVLWGGGTCSANTFCSRDLKQEGSTTSAKDVLVPPHGHLGKAEIGLMTVGNQELLLGSRGRIQIGKWFWQDKHITFYQSLLIWEQVHLFFPQLSSIKCRETRSMLFILKVAE